MLNIFTIIFFKKSKYDQEMSKPQAKNKWV